MIRTRKMFAGELLVAGALGAASLGLGATAAGASTFTVTNTNAAGAGSFSAAIASANAHGGADVITFAPSLNGHTIAEPTESVLGPLTIKGNGVGKTIVAGEIDTDNTSDAISNLTVGDINANAAGKTTTTLTLTNILVTTDGININSGFDNATNNATLTNVTVNVGGININSGFKTTASLTGVTVIGDEINVNSGDSTTATITNSSVVNSRSNGINVSGQNTSVLLAGDTFSNSGSDGINNNLATLRVVNSTIAGSHSSGLNLGGRVTLQNVTDIGSLEGALSLFGGSLSMTNTILEGQRGEGGLCSFGETVLTSHGGNIAGDDSCGLTNASDHPSTDAHLGALGANGGPTKTMVPNAGSPAIDGGVAAGCPEIDQRGVTRPRDGDGNGTAVCDSGAVEVVGKSGATTTVAPTTVTAASTPTTLAPTTVAPAAELPRTGSSSAPLGVAGALLVAVGAALGYGTRRRRTL